MHNILEAYIFFLRFLWELRTELLKLLRNMNLIEKNSEFGYPKFYEAARIFFVRKENNNNIIYSAILFPELPSSAIL